MKHIDVIPINEDKNDYIIQGAEAHTLNLLEDLAKIEYIFADKTGTLTQNELVFKEISILDGQDFKLIENENLKNYDLTALSGSEQMFLTLLLCQDCISLPDSKLGQRYSGQSIDEVCLMDMARDVK